MERNQFRLSRETINKKYKWLAYKSFLREADEEKEEQKKSRKSNQNFGMKSSSVSLRKS